MANKNPSKRNRNKKSIQPVVKKSTKPSSSTGTKQQIKEFDSLLKKELTYKKKLSNELIAIESAVKYTTDKNDKSLLNRRINQLKKELDIAPTKKRKVSPKVHRRNVISHLLSEHLKKTKIDIGMSGLKFQDVVTNIYNSTGDVELKYISQNFDTIFIQFSGIKDVQTEEVAEDIPYYNIANELSRTSYEGFAIKLRCIFTDINGNHVDVTFPEVEDGSNNPMLGGDTQAAIKFCQPIVRQLRALESSYAENDIKGFYPYFHLEERVGDRFLYYKLELYADGESKFIEWSKELHGQVKVKPDVPEKKEKETPGIKEVPESKDVLLKEKIREKELDIDKLKIESEILDKKLELEKESRLKSQEINKMLEKGLTFEQIEKLLGK